MKQLLMVSPDHFDITYAINPHMRDENGELHKVDRAKARDQWKSLKATYDSIGLKVEILKGQPKLPDMVFTANQAFCLPDKKVILSRMRSPLREPEVKFFKQWYEKHGYEVCELNSKGVCFEGTGDAVYHASKKKVFGAFGPRTDREVYDELKRRFGLDVVILELTSPDFYHLDTCFSILSDDTVAIYAGAFNANSLKKIRANFADVIEVSLEESRKFFACNCYCPDGKNVLVQKGSKKFIDQLSKRGFVIHEIETSEFIRAGGSVFCLKMELF